MSGEEVNLKEVGITIDKYVCEKNFHDLEFFLDSLKSVVSNYVKTSQFALFYYLGTGYSELSNHYFQKNNPNQSRRFKELSFTYFRSSISALQDVRRNDHTNVSPQEEMIYTNYALALLGCDRVIEAIRVLRHAIECNPEFGMALASYGGCLNFYAQLCNNPTDKNILHYHANLYIKRALSLNDLNMYPDAKEHYQKISEAYDNTDWQGWHIKQGNIGVSKRERSYRQWCLDKHLFLTPLNDLIETENSYAEDSLVITQCIEPISNEPPKWFAMLNQLKEEYIFLRYLYYESLDLRKRPHFADKRVAISSASYDYALYSIRQEQLKICFKNLYSILDQIAFVVNAYWNLGFEVYQASAANVFKSNEHFQGNSMLLALYWSYREFWEKFEDSSKAYERDLKCLRNALEHRFVKVVALAQRTEAIFEHDDFVFVEEKTLQKYVLRMLQLTREWIICLVYAINIEEIKKEFPLDKAVCLTVNDFPDSLKL